MDINCSPILKADQMEKYERYAKLKARKLQLKKLKVKKVKYLNIHICSINVLKDLLKIQKLRGKGELGAIYNAFYT